MVYLFLGLGFQELIGLILIFLITIAFFGAFIYGIIKLYHRLNSKNDK